MHETYYSFLIIGTAFALAGFVKGMVGMACRRSRWASLAS
jgi:hypothetical protein